MLEFIHSATSYEYSSVFERCPDTHADAFSRTDASLNVYAYSYICAALNDLR